MMRRRQSSAYSDQVEEAKCASGYYRTAHMSVSNAILALLHSFGLQVLHVLRRFSLVNGPTMHSFFGFPFGLRILEIARGPCEFKSLFSISPRLPSSPALEDFRIGAIHIHEAEEIVPLPPGTCPSGDPPMVVFRFKAVPPSDTSLRH
jgi:hypothetical protein